MSQKSHLCFLTLDTRQTILVTLQVTVHAPVARLCHTVVHSLDRRAARRLYFPARLFAALRLRRSGSLPSAAQQWPAGGCIQQLAGIVNESNMNNWFDEFVLLEPTTESHDV